MKFDHAEVNLQAEIELTDPGLGERLGVWAYMYISYGLRCVGLRAEFYRLAAPEPSYDKIVIPALEKHGEQPTEDILQKPLADLDHHMTSQLMKAVAALSASNDMKKAGRSGGDAGRN